MVNIVAFAGFVGVVTLIRLKNEILQREKHRPWVRDMLERG
jgi:heme exporter protein C